jgi:proteasome accessory factor A
MKTNRPWTQGLSASPLPKLCGADIELGNFIVGLEQSTGTGYEASRALLAEIQGFPSHQDLYYGNGYNEHSYYGYRIAALSNAYSAGSAACGDEHLRTGTCSTTALAAYNPQDISRRFLSSNGSCAYIDLDHLELCIPEVCSAYDHVAAWHAMLRLARIALRAANEKQPEGRRIQVLVNNSDGRGNSYGSHLSFLIRRRTFDNIFHRKAHHLQYLASFQVSGIILTGQGKVGAENGKPTAPYQVSQRADFCMTLQGVQTTYLRPICNARDEDLCGQRSVLDPSAPARLHGIFFDSALAHGTALFRVGPTQLILTLIELGMVNPRLILDDPLEALLDYSHDPTLEARAELISGQRLTALELQSAYLEEVKRYAAQGVFEGIVPRADEIIALWEDTLNKFAQKDWDALARRLDWVMKLTIIERAMERRPELDWESPEIKVIDHLYSSLDDDGLYWAYEASGLVEQLVPPERVAHFTENPPEDTRAWTRAMLLRRAAPNSVVSVDWDSITFKMGGRYNWPTYRTFHLPDPRGFTRAETELIFDGPTNFEYLLGALEDHARREAQPAATPLKN